MSTLKELLEGRELPVKVVRDFGTKKVCIDLVASNGSYCIGFGDNGLGYSVYYDEECELYTEQKKKVKVALYAYKLTGIDKILNFSKADKLWKVSRVYFKDDNHFKEYGPFQGQVDFIRLQHTEIEVDDE